MGQVHWSEPALDDLRDIVSFVAKDSPAYATRLATRMWEKQRTSHQIPGDQSVGHRPASPPDSTDGTIP